MAAQLSNYSNTLSHVLSRTYTPLSTKAITFWRSTLLYLLSYNSFPCSSDTGFKNIIIIIIIIILGY